mgnify:CR=1 FL=1
MKKFFKFSLYGLLAIVVLAAYPAWRIGLGHPFTINQLANRQAKVPPLKAGQELWLSVDTGVLGTFFYEFTADCKNDLKEVNESNNVGYLDRTIK